jgi:hypothetical protein
MNAQELMQPDADRSMASRRDENQIDRFLQTTLEATT